MVVKFIFRVTILILVDGFLQFTCREIFKRYGRVTILILVDGFLQYILVFEQVLSKKGHNPYFSRWFSAI